MADLFLVVVGKDTAAVNAFVMPALSSFDTHVYIISNNTGTPLSKISNECLEFDNFRPSAVFGLCHADVVFGPDALEDFTAEAMRGAVCGIVGVDLAGCYRCCYSPETPFCGPGPVSTLDGMAVFFRRDLGLRFDEQTFDGFHCHVEDLCLQAHKRGIPVTVPAADAHHRNHGQSQAWLVDYRKYRRRLAEKWKGTEFRTT